MYGEISSLSLPFRIKDRLIKSGYFTLSQILLKTPELLKQELKIPYESAHSVHNQATELIFTLQSILTYKQDTRLLPSMINHLDDFLHGGYRTGGLYEIVGPPCIGKTMLSMQMCISAAKSGYSSVYIDTEGSFSKDRLEEIAVGKAVSPEEVLEKVSYVRVVSFTQFENLFEQIEDHISKHISNCILIVIDSLQIPFKETDSNIFKGKLLAKYGLKFQRIAKRFNLVFLVTNKLTQVGSEILPQFGDSWNSVITSRIWLTPENNEIYATLELTEGTVRIQLSLIKEGLESRSQSVL